MAVGDTVGLLFRISADSNPAQAEIRAFSGALSREIAGMEASFGSATSSAGIFGGALTGLGTIALSAAGSFLFMVGKVAEAENHLYELSQKTQLSVETLSALDRAAQSSDTSVDKLAQGLVIFDKNLSKANTSHDAASKLLKSWNIDLSNNDHALQQVALRLADYSKSGNKVADAQALMGRSGSEFLKITNQLWKEAGGNLEVYKQKLIDSGVLITSEQAREGHEFREQLKQTENQFGALFRAVATEFMPGIISAMQGVTEWLKDNREFVKGVIEFIGGILDAAIVKPLQLVLWLVGEIGGALKWLANQMPKFDVYGIVRQGAPGLLEGAGFGGVVGKRMGGLFESSEGPQAPPLPGKGGGGKGVKEDPRIKLLEEQRKELDRQLKEETENIKRDYEEQRITIETKTEDLVTAIRESYVKRRAVLLQEQALAKKPENREKYGDLLTTIDVDTSNEIRKAYDDEAKVLRDSRHKLQEDILAVQDEFDKRSINAVRARIQTEQFTEVEGEKQVADIERAAYKRRWDDLVAQREDVIKRARDVQEGANSQEARQLDAQIKLLEEKEKTAEEERERRIAGAEKRALELQGKYLQLNYDLEEQNRQKSFELRQTEIDELLKYYGERYDIQVDALVKQTDLYLDEEDALHKRNDDEMRADAERNMGVASSLEEWLALAEEYNGLWEKEELRHQAARAAIMKKSDEAATRLQPVQKALTSLKAIGLDAFNSLAQGVGSMVEAWAKGADLGQNAIGKIISSVLAGVAAQAATQAVLFTAYGVAALTPWGAAIYGPASQWFEAAALMAAVAATAAVAGRAFSSPQATSSTSGGAATASSSTNTSSSPTPIVTDRTGGQPVVTHRVEIGLKDGLVVQHFVKDFMLNGQTRLVITTDGQKI